MSFPAAIPVTTANNSPIAPARLQVFSDWVVRASHFRVRQNRRLLCAKDHALLGPAPYHPLRGAESARSCPARDGNPGDIISAVFQIPWRPARYHRVEPRTVKSVGPRPQGYEESGWSKHHARKLPICAIRSFAQAPRCASDFFHARLPRLNPPRKPPFNSYGYRRKTGPPLAPISTSPKRKFFRRRPYKTSNPKKGGPFFVALEPPGRGT